jgi:IMP dehydrogenase
MKIRKGYTFDDLMLVPKHSTIESRKVRAGHIKTHVDLGKGILLNAPIVSANMKNVTEEKMAMAICGIGMPIFHRFCDIGKACSMLQTCRLKEPQTPDHFASSVGISVEDKERAEKLVEYGAKILCVDVAHGDHSMVLDVVEYYAKIYPHVLLIAGNVATAAGALRLYNAGADVIKVGIGPGSLCTTRIETGNGVPQMTALYDVFSASCEGARAAMDPVYDGSVYAKNRKFKIIADGGIRQGGDVIKALCFSDVVMLGSMLAGTDEAPGEAVTINGAPHKAYEGSSTHKTSNVEGVKALVQCKGPVENVINKVLDGLRSGLSYQGAKNLEVLKEDPEFVEVTNAGLIESHPHDVVIR